MSDESARGFVHASSDLNPAKGETAPGAVSAVALAPGAD